MICRTKKTLRISGSSDEISLALIQARSAVLDQIYVLGKNKSDHDCQRALDLLYVMSMAIINGKRIEIEVSK